MRKIFWAFLILAAYFWVVSSGREQIFIRQGKHLYDLLVSWFSDAELDFQLQNNKNEKTLRVEKQEKAQKKKSRRWD